MTEDEFRRYSLEYPDALGRLMANLGSLEVNLRIALYLIDTPAAERRPFDQKLAHVKVDEMLPLSYLTSWHTLGELIDAYNDRQQSRGRPTVLIDSSIKSLRDALAHGRIIARSEFEESTLIRFAKPVKGATTVRVEYTQLLTIEWFGQQLAWIADAAQAVADRIQEFASPST